jgi:hypothetical protein
MGRWWNVELRLQQSYAYQLFVHRELARPQRRRGEQLVELQSDAYKLYVKRELGSEWLRDGQLGKLQSDSDQLHLLGQYLANGRDVTDT